MGSDVHAISKNTQIILVVTYLLIGILFVIFIPNNISIKYITDYLIVLLSYFIVTGIWIYCIAKKGIYLFEPITMVMGITLISFSIEPMISIITNNLDINGFYVFEGCKKATILYIFAALLYMICYYNKIAFRNHKYKNDDKVQGIPHTEQIRNKTMVLFWAWFFALVGVGVSLINLLMHGYSLQYILSLGISGTLKSEDSSLGVFINLRYCMIPALLYLYKYSKAKWLSYLLTLIALACMFMDNKRWIIIVAILAPLVLKYIEENRKPSAFKIAILAIALIIVVGAMQYMRYFATSSIAETSWDGFSLWEIWKGFSGNFDLYKTLYGAVVYFPEKHFYTLGQQMIFLTLVTGIPRAIWPGKPKSIFEVLKPLWLGPGSVQGAWAYAQLTEMYVEFGTIGTLLIMGLYGIICRHLKHLYTRKRSIHNLILYSFVFPMLMQFTIRGYMPNNFWALFFMVAPWFIIKKMDSRRI